MGGIPEVMEVILGQLPISQLYCVCRLVCRKWNAIIQREKVNMPAGKIVPFSIDFANIQVHVYIHVYQCKLVLCLFAVLVEFTLSLFPSPTVLVSLLEEDVFQVQIRSL